MISMRTLNVINNFPPIKNFIRSPPKIVNVDGASATVRKYLKSPLIIDRTQMRDPVIIVKEFLFILLIKMNILGPHDAQLGDGASSSIVLVVEKCIVC